VVKSFILVSAFSLLTSVGLASDVGVDTILSPSGTVDSGQTIIPRCVVSNLGSVQADSVNAWLRIDDGTPSGYRDSIVGLSIPAQTRETLTFSGWVPRGRDSMDAIAWVVCPSDTFPSNDTARQRFLVRVKDIAVTQIISPAPDTVLDSGSVFYPQARVWNFGNISLNFDVEFHIGAYHSTRNLDLIAGGARVATAPDLYHATPGIWACRVTAIVAGDLHPENNVLDDTFWVRGAIRESLGVRVLMPDTIFVGDTITPRARAVNLGDNEASFWVFLSIGDSAGPAWWAESCQVILSPGDLTEIDFPTMVFTEPGAYLAVAMVFNGENPMADSHYFWVVPRPGIEERMKDEGGRMNSGPTIPSRLPPGAVAFDAIGRRVLNPRSGIYFVVTPSPLSSPPEGERVRVRGRSAFTVRKVVIEH